MKVFLFANTLSGARRLLTRPPVAAATLVTQRRSFCVSPVCRSRLAVVRPDIAAEWMIERNDEMDVAKVECTHEYVAWWKCGACGNCWQSSVRDRATLEKGCPACEASAASDKFSIEFPQVAAGGKHSLTASLNETHPHCASLWHDELNGDLKPSDVTSMSCVSVWWHATPAKDQPPFQRPVFQYVFDSRSPQQQNDDAVEVQQAVIKKLEETSQAPVTMSTQPPFVWRQDDKSTVLNYLLKHHGSKRSGKTTTTTTGEDDDVDVVEEEASSTPWQRPYEEYFPKQPMTDPDAALREKAVGYYLFHTVKGKTRRGDTFVAHTSESIEHSLGKIPSLVFDGEALMSPSTTTTANRASSERDVWKKFFSLSPDDAEHAWNLASRNKREALHGSSSDKAARATGSNEEYFDDIEDEVETKKIVFVKSETHVSGGAVASMDGDAAMYPRKPKQFHSPLRSDEELLPRKIVRRSSNQSLEQEEAIKRALANDDAQRDEDGGRRSFGRFDDILEEREAMLLYDSPDPQSTTPAAAAEVALKVSGSRHSNYSTQRRRGFSLEMPADEVFEQRPAASSSSSAVATPTTTAKVTIPNSPRVVARPRRTTAASSDSSQE